jgi:hypothetical protein
VLRGEANDDNVLQIEMDVLIGMVEALLKRSQEDTVAEE